MRNWHIRFEWKVEDCWVGVFWRNGKNRLDLWICFVPMIPLHYWKENQE